MPERYSIRHSLADSTAHVLGPDGWDDDLAGIVREALAGLSRSSERGKYSLQMERFLCFEADPGERCDVLLDEDLGAARDRCSRFLQSLGCIVGPARGRRDKSRLVKLKTDVDGNPVGTGNMGDIQIAIRVMRDFYDAARNVRLFTSYNPCEVDGWEEGSARRIAAGKRGKNEQGHIGEESGNQFRVDEHAWYPPLPHDPASCGRQAMLAVSRDVAASHSWPPGAVLLVKALVDGGARFEDTHVLTAADWAVGSRFGRGIIAPDKGSHGIRDKMLVISERLRQMLADSFDERHRLDPTIPDHASLHEKLAEGKLDELAKLPLFPNRAGSFFKYSNFNNDWFRPCMIRQEVVVQSSVGVRRVTPHWLRHAKVTKHVAGVFAMGGSREEIRKALSDLAEDFGWKKDMLERYAHNFFLTIRLEQRIAAMDAMDEVEQVRPRLTTLHRAQSASAMLNPEIAALHAGLPE